MLLKHVYFIVFLYFLIGAISIFFINLKRNDVKENAERWLKYLVYFVIVNIIIDASWHNNRLKFIGFAILLLGLCEILYVWLSLKERHISQLFSATAILFIAGYGFWHYSIIDSAYNRLYVYVLVFVFDGFCQISGQLFGKHKLSPRISPNKTVEGLLGGYVITVATVLALRNDLDFNFTQSVFISSILCIAALAGDLAASYYKRICKVKDYSKIIPGHGGVLDRFDSFIAAGAAFYFIYYFHLFNI